MMARSELALALAGSGVLVLGERMPEGLDCPAMTRPGPPFDLVLAAGAAAIRQAAALAPGMLAPGILTLAPLLPPGTPLPARNPRRFGDTLLLDLAETTAPLPDAQPVDAAAILALARARGRNPLREAPTDAMPGLRHVPGEARDYTGILRPPPLAVAAPDGLEVPDWLRHPAPIWQPPPYALAVEEAVVFGHCAVATPDGVLLTDRHYLEKLGGHFTDPAWRRFQAMALQPACGALFGRRHEAPSRRIAGACSLVAAAEPGSYGAFLLRSIPKLLSLKQLDLLHLPALVACDQAWQRALLAAFGLPPARLVHHDSREAVQVERLHVIGQRCPHLYLDPPTQEAFQDFARAALAEYGAGPKRLYVSRAGQGQRRCANEDALVAALARLGFQAVAPERLSIRQQAALFQGAEVVVGACGSGLFNAVFCRPGTRLVAVEPVLLWLSQYASIFASCHLRHGFVLGGADATDPAPVHKRWVADIPAVLGQVEMMLALA